MQYSRKQFYTLSFTWGLLLTLVGCCVAAYLIVTGHKPQKWGYCYYFEVGKTNWGGLELGPIFLTGKNASTLTKNHEHGHALQNCTLGPLMPFVVSIPSAIRYWYREYLVRSGAKKHYELPDYDSVWFEGDASKSGTEFMEWYNTQQND